MQVATRLIDAGWSVSVVSAAQAHHVAQGLGQRAKTDAIDAQTVAQLAAHQRPTPWTPPPAISTTLQHCLAQRERFLQARGQAQHHLHGGPQLPQLTPTGRVRQAALSTSLTDQIVAGEAELASWFKQEPAWERSVIQRQTIPGIGFLTAAR